mmetsp:Transcript_108644/g.198136  ORF Transcript_108644/g.198136 Transcript_108644/m.198136 type:complete len:234 (+) Transcript_108644:304-1005(+)
MSRLKPSGIASLGGLIQGTTGMFPAEGASSGGGSDSSTAVRSNIRLSGSRGVGGGKLHSERGSFLPICFLHCCVTLRSFSGRHRTAGLTSMARSWLGQSTTRPHKGSSTLVELLVAVLALSAPPPDSTGELSGGGGSTGSPCVVTPRNSTSSASSSSSAPTPGAASAEMAVRAEGREEGVRRRVGSKTSCGGVCQTVLAGPGHVLTSSSNISTGHGCSGSRVTVGGGDGATSS